MMINTKEEIPKFRQKIDIDLLSVNKCWQGRRFKTGEYTAYEQEALYKLKSTKTVKGDISVSLTFYIKNFKRRDIDNFAKPILDILVKKGIIEDDRKVIELHLKKLPAETDSLKIEVYNLE